MERAEIKKLINKAIGLKETWADLGSGDGAFTMALRELGGREIKLISLDKNGKRLDRQKQIFFKLYPDTNIQFINQDFTIKPFLPPLDGLLMANSLHFVPNQQELISHFRSYLKPGGRLVLVEYATISSSMFIPYPIPFEKFCFMAKTSGYLPVVKLAETPSRYWNQIYSAMATNSG